MLFFRCEMDSMINMDDELILYHGSPNIVKKPTYGFGSTKNDFGSGFYCTLDEELAKEWACQKNNFGYTNMYALSCEGLKILDLTESNIYAWLSVLINFHDFGMQSYQKQENKKI